MYTLRIVVLLLVICIPAITSETLDVDSLGELIGYTILAASTVSGDFDGADYDKLVKLDNGMTFEFEEYSYSYSYRPAAVVLGKAIDIPGAGRRTVIYKLVVDDEIYDVRRIR